MNEVVDALGVLGTDKVSFVVVGDLTVLAVGDLTVPPVVLAVGAVTPLNVGDLVGGGDLAVEDLNELVVPAGDLAAETLEDLAVETLGIERISFSFVLLRDGPSMFGW